MAFIEAPTNFYLGRTFDPQTQHLGDDVVYYDSRDLTTHAVVVGMTGSGKTGLCVSLLEEAILDNIPAIVIDPKGDITNLLLAFPNLSPQEFQPWIHADDARRAGMDIPTYSADVANRWQSGLAKWGIVPERITWMKHAAKYSIYTPGSDSGLPISIMASLKAPSDGWHGGNEEEIREKINGITTALLALAGLSVRPVQDKEHVLVSNIFEFNWRQGRDLTLEDIILQIQNPPFEKLGVFQVDQYMSEKDRFKLAMEMNNIIASPSFQSWIHGESMDIQRLLYQPNGRPKVSIFYIAHLNESERMFITTLILESMLGWMRSLSGTTSLRAILYIDEMFGYFPPYPKNPPTKEPILRLLKQARAFGIGLILATQNPGDLDYKGLSNMGTWFIGRLQSDNDRKKVMSGLEAMASADDSMDLDDVEEMISNIKPRVFLMRNVHNTGGPLLLHTRWTMSYLSGPLTRQQVQALMANQRQELMATMAASYYGQQQTQPLQQQYPQQYSYPPPPPAYGQGGTGGYPPMPGQGGYGTQSAPAYPPPLPGFPQQGNTGGYPPMPGQGGYGTQAASAYPPPPPGFPQQGNTGGYPPVPGQTGYGTQPVSGNSQPLQSNTPQGFSENQPAISSSIPQYFLPNTLTVQQSMQASGYAGGENAVLAYIPVLFAQTTVRYQQKTSQIYTSREYAFHVPDLEKAGFINWEEYLAPTLDRSQLGGQPFGQAIFGDLSGGLADKNRINALKKELVDSLYNTAKLIVPFHPQFKVYGHPDKDMSDFQTQVQQLAREKRDIEIDKLSSQYGQKMDRLEDKYKRKVREFEAEKAEIRDRKREELFTTGEAIFSLFKGRTNYTLSRMSRATRYKRQTEADIEESKEVIDEVQSEMGFIEQEYEDKLKQINDKWAQIANDYQDYNITPYKKDISVDLYGIGWLPHWYVLSNGQPILVSAFQ